MTHSSERVYKQTIMFVEGFKEGLKYTGSVASRTFGIDAGLNWPRYTGVDNTTSNKFFNRVGAGLGFALFQFVFPSTWGAVMSRSSRTESPYPAIARGAIDGLPWSIIFSVTQNPVEIALYRTVANVATNIGWDLLEAGINRIPKFRPPTAATLTV